MVMCSNGIISSDPTSTIFDLIDTLYRSGQRLWRWDHCFKFYSFITILGIFNKLFFCILFFFLIRHISPTHSEYFLTEQSNIYLKQLLISFENLCIEWRPSSLVNWLPLSQTLGDRVRGGGVQGTGTPANRLFNYFFHCFMRL